MTDTPNRERFVYDERTEAELPPEPYAAGSRPTAPEPSETATKAAMLAYCDGGLRASLRAAYAVDALAGSPQPPAGDPSEEMLAAGVEAFRKTTAYWAPECLASEAHIAKLVESVVRAALRGGSHQPEET